MALNPPNSGNLEQLALKGLSRAKAMINIVIFKEVVERLC